MYANKSIKYFLICIDVLEKNLTLHGKKYIEWKVQLYLETSRVYEQFSQFDKACSLLERGREKLRQHMSAFETSLQNRASDEMDILKKCEDYFTSLILKFKMLQNQISVQEFISMVKSKLNLPVVKTFGLLEGIEGFGLHM